MTENEIEILIVNAADEVHTHLEPGLLESAFPIRSAGLYYKLKKEGLDVNSEVHLPL